VRQIFRRYVLGYEIISIACSPVAHPRHRLYAVFFLRKLVALTLRWRDAVDECEALSGLKYGQKRKERSNVKRT
jgi:hypothetical protein